MERKFYIGSAGKPGDGYDKENFNRCVEEKAHILHCDTTQKGVFDCVKPKDVIFLKYNFHLVAYGEVLKVERNSEYLTDKYDKWNWGIFIKEWFFYDSNETNLGISKYGVGSAIIAGSQMATVKEIGFNYALDKMKEINSENELINSILMSKSTHDTINKYTKTLSNNHNIILTGAPGTGKTFLARRIAEEFIKQNGENNSEKPLSISKVEIKSHIKPNKTILSSKGKTEYHIDSISDKHVNISGESIVSKSIPFKDIIDAYCKKLWEGGQKNGLDSYTAAISKHIYDNISSITSYEKQIGFVQFHPSYDYTDFVEGLRAEKTEDGVTFTLRNGIFKEFCMNAISDKSKSISFDELYDDFIVNGISNINFETPHKKNPINYSINSKKSFLIKTNKTEMVVRKDLIKEYVLNDVISDWKSYVVAIGDKFKELYQSQLQANEDNKRNDNKEYVFIIDEINRGEISKIFGELFFSIDPGYRVKQEDKFGKSHVTTQYANLQSDDTIFDPELGKGYFYVPDNVYIIGTMNDIDRSVESMDFAMRRRFTWMEITADARVEMLSDLGEDMEIAIKRMQAINKVIFDDQTKNGIEGLSSAYHIGPAYFLKLKNYKESEHEKWESLWNYHLLPLISEYLRGMPDAIENIKKIKNAYDLKGQADENADQAEG